MKVDRARWLKVSLSAVQVAVFHLIASAAIPTLPPPPAANSAQEHQAAQVNLGKKRNKAKKVRTRAMQASGRVLAPRSLCFCDAWRTGSKCCVLTLWLECLNLATFRRLQPLCCSAVWCSPVLLS